MEANAKNRQEITFLSEKLSLINVNSGITSCFLDSTSGGTYKSCEVQMDEDRNAPVSLLQRAYNGHSKATMVKLWKMAFIAFSLQKEIQLYLFHAKRKLGFLLAPEVDTHGSLVPQKLCYNNAPAVPGAPFSTAHWRYVSCWIQLGQNIEKVPHHATPHQLSRIKPLTLGISSWNWIEIFRRNFMSLRSCFA